MGLALQSSRAAMSISPHPIDTDKVAAVILSGGEGNRLYPFTKYRCKPAISYGGRHRLIDIPISNALNSGLKKIFILSQYLSYSLHQHLSKTYRSFHCVETLTPETNPNGKSWYAGTADAVRQNLHYLSELNAEYFLILSGDQIYRMDLRHMLAFAQETGADAIVAALPVSASDAKRMGIMQVDTSGFIRAFHEKPQTEEELLKLLPEQSTGKGDAEYIGSMGIYLFKRKALFQLLKEDLREDFGKHLIPAMVAAGNIAAYVHPGYWRDIGTIDSFYEANMELTKACPAFNLYDEKWPIFSYNAHLPGASICNTHVERSLICEGGAINAASIRRSVIGPRVSIHRGAAISDTYVIGNDYFLPPWMIPVMPKNFKLDQTLSFTKRSSINMWI